MVAQAPAWNRPLTHRFGSPTLLVGIELYYDFDWYARFGHRRSQFPRGQSLAQLVYEDCPVGKFPTLLLTDQDVPPGILDSEERFTVVVPVDDYLAHSNADPASTYYARACAAPMTRLATLAEVDFSPEQLQSFLVENLSRDVLMGWAQESAEHATLLSDVARALDDEQPAGSMAVSSIDRLESLDQEVLDAVTRYLERVEGSGVAALIRLLTDSTDGRATTTGVLSERLADRISDTRRELDAYQTLIDETTVTETQVQSFLERCPWIVGLPYVGARPRVQIPRGEIDFVLDRFDGFFDIVELKGPRDTIIDEPVVEPGTRPASASSYAVGPTLARALAQAHHYRAILDQSRELTAQFGLGDSRQPRILIVLGRSTDLSPSATEILRQLNLTLHRVEIIPYDVLGRRTEGLLANVESLAAGGAS